MFIKDVDQLLKPGYLPIETGYCRLSNGQMYVAALTRMSGCKKEWVDWYFRSFIRDDNANEEFKKEAALVTMNVRPPSHFVGANPYTKHFMEGKLLNFKVILEDPSLYFDVSKIQESGVSVVYCGRSFLPDGTPDAHIIRVVRDTAYGCEMRSRYWIDGDTEEGAKDRLENCLSDMGDLADSLETLIKDVQTLEKNDEITCKFCHSHEVVKNGTRKNHQYWLCKQCKRGFVNNQALPKMKYPIDTMIKAVYDYYSGYSLNTIRRNIEKETNILPSASSISRWITKMKDLAIEKDKIASRPFKRKELNKN